MLHTNVCHLPTQTFGESQCANPIISCLYQVMTKVFTIMQSGDFKDACPFPRLINMDGFL